MAVPSLSQFLAILTPNVAPGAAYAGVDVDGAC